MRDQFAGDISDLIKFSLLRAVAHDKHLGVAWYFVPDQNGMHDGRHVEFREEEKWKNLDELVWDELRTMKDRSVIALEQMKFWPTVKTFHKKPVQSGISRDQWKKSMIASLDYCDLIFLDPDNGLGKRSQKHATADEVREIGNSQRPVILIKFPARINYDVQIKSYHEYLVKECGVKTVSTLRVGILLDVKTKNGNWQKMTRHRWFSLLNGNNILDERLIKFKERLSNVDGVSVQMDSRK